ncbi:TPM domain-containing protein [Pseudomonas sp.]|jgi:uncharacterized protein|uniref:TPM domain-containing protein n=1 Tax=Pseudomonas sp. TaxID=306 RepID=UPI00272D46F8|nr:TPM domain-containing protein [Pseudomonas sp.]
MSRLLGALLALVLLSAPLVAQDAFPPLTGRVVDQAGMIDTQVEAQLTRMLAGHEQATGEQLVVVTIPTLAGRSIEEYGVELGRHWGIGQRGEDNGALLIIAQEERRLRIEVGYGLEDRLTDAQAAMIINGIITPAFRQGQFQQGIVRGTEAMIQVLGGDPLQVAGDPRVAQEPEHPPAILLLFLFIVIMSVLAGGRGGRGRFGRAVLAGALLGGMGRGGGRGGFGGGFGGGGGGFGGGGASGGW